MIALLTVFLSTERWAGVLALSTYVPLDSGLVFFDNATPLLMAHGTEDAVVPIRMGKKTFDVLRHLGPEVFGSGGSTRWDIRSVFARSKRSGNGCRESLPHREPRENESDFL